MHLSTPKLQWFGLLFFSLGCLTLTAQETLSVSVLNGTEIRCYPDSLVRIEITPNTDFAFTAILVDWGDGSTPVSIMPGDALILEHQYPIAQFLEDCSYNQCGLANGFCFTLTIDAQYGGATQPENISKRLTFQFPPRPNFAADDNFICVGQEFCLDNFTCPDNDDSMTFLWTLPDGTTSTEESPCYTFPSAGTFPIMLEATNDCGTVTTNRNFTVTALPIAAAVLDSGSVALDNDIYYVCLEDGGKVRLNGDASENANTFNWSFSPTTGVTFVTNMNNDTTCVRFTNPGTYVATLRVDNGCNTPDEISLNIEVSGQGQVSLDPQEDGCLTLDYSPSPLLPGVIYTVNGTTYASTDFPLSLVTNNDPFLVTASSPPSFCPTVMVSDTFYIFGISMPMITLPQQDTTICQDTVQVLLAAQPPGGTWSVNNGLPLLQENGEVYFQANQPNGSYLATYSLGFGACAGEATRTITIQSPTVTTDGPWTFCQDGPLETLTATPINGTWSGMGITDPMLGTFNPSAVAPGLYDVFYSFNDASATGCTVTVANQVTVVALPSAIGIPDTFAICAVDMDLPLPTLVGISFSPSGGTADWNGAGIVNSTSGMYNPASVGGPIDTVIVSYTIDPGCEIRDTFIVTIDEITPVVAQEDLTVCDNEANPILTATPAGQGLWSGTGIDPVTGEVDIALLMAGQTYTYQYTINPDFMPCTNSDEVDLTLANGAGVSIAQDELFVCDTASFVVLPAGNPSNGVWEGSPAISNDTLFLGILPIGNISLGYVAPDLPAACNSAVLTISYAAQPTVEIVSDSSACVVVDCLPFQAVTGGASAFSWDFGDATGSSDQQTCHTYTNEGLYAVTLTGYLLNPVTNQTYCASAPATTEVDILGALSEVDIIPSSTADCPDYLVDVMPSVVDIRNTYTWTLAGITDSVATGLTNVLLPATVEDTIYFGLLTTTNGCDSQFDTIALTALAPLQAQVATDFDFPCSGETVQLYNNSTGAIGNTPQWTIDGVVYNGFEPPAFQVFTDTLPTSILVTLIDSNNCNADTATYVIEIQPTDVRARMNYSSPDVCVGAALELINISTPGAFVRWVTSDGNQYVGDTVSHQFMAPGPAWVTIFAEGCGYDSLRYDFTVLPRPELSLDIVDFACAEEPVTFTVGGNASGQLLYYGNGDSTLQTISQYTYPQPGSYDIRLLGASTAGCLDSLTDQIVINPLPEALVLQPDSVCVGEPVALISLSIDAESCTWQLADGGTRDNCISSYTFDSPGLKTNQLLVTSNLGCRDSVSFPVFVRPTPVAAFNYVGEDDCSPAIVQFVYTNTTPVPTSWSWDLGDNTISNEINPLHTYPFGGTYPVTLVVGIDGICFDTTLQNVPVRGTPGFDTLTLDERCLPTEAFILEVSTNAENEITLTGDNYSQAGINRFEIIPPGDYTLEILAPSGCDTTLSFTVQQIFPLSVELMPDTTILLGASVRIVSQVNATNLLLEWWPIEGLSDTSLLEPIAMPGETITYYLTVSNGECTAVDTVTIFVDEDVQVYFPNVFSPNGDGFNDRYTFFPTLGVQEVASFQLFNRWGGLVYEVIAPPLSPSGISTWNGDLNGKPVNPDTFVYVAELLLTNGKRVQYRGSVHLVR